MSLAFDPLVVPLKIDADGVARVGGTRVTLETLVGAFRRGATPEEIVQDYSSLHLADVYAVIAYYLRDRAAVDAYLLVQQQRSEAIQRQMEALFDPTGVRERLLARRKETA
jgi:uncharacterized protein (DUF433 family)